MFKNQKGIAVLETILILMIVGIVAATGWYVYSQQKETKSTAQNQQTSNNQKPEGGEFCAEVEKLCFTYPAGWELTSKTHQPVPEGMPDWEQDEVVINSPKSTIVMKLNSGIDGLGGMCEPNEYEGFKHITVKSHKLPIKTNDYDEEFHVPDLYAVATVDVTPHNDGMGYKPIVYITSNKYAAKVGEHNVCDVSFSTYFRSSNGPSVSFTGEDPTGTTYPTADEPKRLLESEEFIRAFEILKTAHYK